MRTISVAIIVAALIIREAIFLSAGKAIPSPGPEVIGYGLILVLFGIIFESFLPK